MGLRACYIALTIIPLTTPAAAQDAINSFSISGSCQRNSFACTSYERAIIEYQEAEKRKLSVAAESAEIEKSCNLVAEKIRMCDPLRNWRPITTDFQVDQQYANEDGFSAQISSSDGGIYHGLSADAAASAVIKMAQRNTAITDFRLLSSEAGGTETFPKRVLTYSGAIENIHFAYINTIIVGKTRNAQLITIEVGREPSDRGRVAHAEFIDTIRLADGF